MLNHVLPWSQKQLPVGRTVGFAPALLTEFDEPFREVERFLDKLFTTTPPVAGSDEILRFSPTLDLRETEKTFEINLELPGMSPENIDISIAKDMLIISGEKKEEKEEGKKGLYRLERRYGSFSRSIPLPDNCVDTEGVQARYKDGVLTITLPKRVGYTEAVKKIPVATVADKEIEAESKTS